MNNTLFAVVAFLGFILLFTLALRYGAVFLGQIMGQRVNASHRAMEIILDSEKIPQEWLEPTPREPAQVPMWQQRQKRNAIKKLRELRSYAENTPAFSDPESREFVLGELARIQNQWVAQDFADITDA